MHLINFLLGTGNKVLGLIKPLISVAKGTTQYSVVGRHVSISALKDIYTCTARLNKSQGTAAKL